MSVPTAMTENSEADKIQVHAESMHRQYTRQNTPACPFSRSYPNQTSFPVHPGII
jgi:hypothetical protein